MSDTPTKVVVNCETGVTDVLPLTAQEIADMETARVAAEAEQAEREAQAEALATLKASAKAKLIAGTPLTSEEADTLVI